MYDPKANLLTSKLRRSTILHVYWKAFGRRHRAFSDIRRAERYMTALGSLGVGLSYVVVRKVEVPTGFMPQKGSMTRIHLREDYSVLASR